MADDSMVPSNLQLKLGTSTESVPEKMNVGSNFPCSLSLSLGSINPSEHQNPPLVRGLSSEKFQGVQTQHTERYMLVSEPVARRDLHLTSGSGIYSSVTDAASLPHTLLSLNSTEREVLASSGSGRIHPSQLNSNMVPPSMRSPANLLPPLPAVRKESKVPDLATMLKIAQESPNFKAQKDESDLLSQRITMAGLSRHRSAPSAVLRPYPWLQGAGNDVTSLMGTSSNGASLPLLPMKTTPSDEEIRRAAEASRTSLGLSRLGDHLTLAPAQPAQIFSREHSGERQGSLRRSDTLAMNSWHKREDIRVENLRANSLSAQAGVGGGMADPRTAEELVSMFDLRSHESKFASSSHRQQMMDPVEDGAESRERKKMKVHSEGRGHLEEGIERTASGAPDSKRMSMEDPAAMNLVPCKVRAKRGCATHPRSIAERRRRTRIADNMKKLQDLIPGVDKQANTADMLDDAVAYMKYLESKVLDFSNGDKSILNFRIHSKARHDEGEESADGSVGGGSSDSESS